MGDYPQERFNIVVDEDTCHVIYPETAGSEPGTSILKGPDDNPRNNSWILQAFKPHASYEIIYDPNAWDKRKIVVVEWTNRVDVPSMADAFAIHFASEMLEM